MISRGKTVRGKAGSVNGGPTGSRPAKKSLGQNFLVDDNISRKIVAEVSPSREDTLIEIGPGRGALTGLLAAGGGRLIAVEKDHLLAEELAQSFSGRGNVEVVCGDFLEYGLPQPDRLIKVVGNIPYNLTSRIVSRLVDEREKIQSAVLMMQDEVALRLTGAPGTKEYGAISVRLQLVSRVERLFQVTPGCFRPRPRVNSRIVKIVFENRTRLDNEEGFVRFVKDAFGMRRKMFRHFVSARYGRQSIELLDQRFRTGRVETFTPAEIYNIFKILESDVRH